MKKDIFGFTWEFSKGHQIAVLCLTAVSFPFLYLTLELPKRIINNAIGGKNFPMDIFGIQFEQTQFLIVLCVLMLALILVNGAFKMYVNIFKGLIAERLLRRLRYQLYERILRFPMSRFQRTSQGELVSMTTAEVESIGSFFGDAIALPAFQGGTMLTILVFMFVQDPVFGIASVILIPVQGWLIPKLQRQINALNKERVKEVRQLSGHISETVSGIQDVHTHDTSAFNLAKFSFRLGEIFKIRLSIYKKKFFMKFVNNFIGQLTPLMFYSFGGVLVIQGDITLGALVAALAAYKDLTAPWRELLKYYQDMANSRVKYEQVVEQFESFDLIEPRLLQERPEEIPSFKDSISFNSLTFIDEDGERSLSGISLDIKPGSRIAFVASGKACDELACTLVRLLRPTTGSIYIGDLNIASLPESMIGARIGYVGPDSYIFSGTAADNVLFGLKHVPPIEVKMNAERKEAYEEAVASGNSPADINADWIDYNTAGFKDNAELDDWWLKIIQALEIEGDLYARGLNMGLDLTVNSELSDGILQAHEMIAKRLHEDAELAGLVHPFDFNTYNVNASVGSNLIFGEPIGDEFSFESLGENKYVREILKECELEENFVEIGHKVAITMVNLFKDLSPEHPLFDQFSFLDEESLQQLRHLIAHIEQSGLEVLNESEESLLISLAFRLIVDRHRLGLVDEDLQQGIVKARHLFRKNLPQSKNETVAFFDQGSFNDMLSIRCNLIMGRLNLARPRAEERVNELTREVLEELGLRNTITLLATNADVGIGGRRMSQAFRQKLAFARSLIKHPDILIVNRALSVIDQEGRQRIRQNIHGLLPDTTMMWLDSERLSAAEFDNIYVIDNGRIAETITGETIVTADTSDDGDKPDEADDKAELTVLDIESQILAKIPLFSGMSRSNLKLLAFASQRFDFGAEEEVFKQGEAAFAAYAIIDGEAEIIRETNGIETVIHKAGSNEVVGEMAMLNNRPRSATVRTLTDVTVLRIKKDVFLNLVEHDPQLSANIAHMMSQRLDETLQKVGVAA